MVEHIPTTMYFLTTGVFSALLLPVFNKDIIILKSCWGNGISIFLHMHDKTFSQSLLIKGELLLIMPRQHHSQIHGGNINFHVENVVV